MRRRPPSATISPQKSHHPYKLFQSQMRSRSTCDTYYDDYRRTRIPVSISDEKPLHMRLCKRRVDNDAGFVSISDEKPLHMRRVPWLLAWLGGGASSSDEEPLHMRPAAPLEQSHRTQA